MRFEATLPDKRGKALLELAEELGLTRSQLMDEALALFLKVIIETRKGRRLAILEGEAPPNGCELITPSLALMEWTSHKESIELTSKEFEKLLSLEKLPTKPNKALKKAMRKHKK